MNIFTEYENIDYYIWNFPNHREICAFKYMENKDLKSIYLPFRLNYKPFKALAI